MISYVERRDGLRSWTFDGLNVVFILALGWNWMLPEVTRSRLVVRSRRFVNVPSLEALKALLVTCLGIEDLKDEMLLSVAETFR